MVGPVFLESPLNCVFFLVPPDAASRSRGPRRIRTLSILLGSLALTVAASLPGCGAGDGAPCQVDRDCAAGLSCCGETASLRGLCRPSGAAMCAPATDAGPVDSGPPVDAPEVDAGPTEDAGPTLDVGPLLDAPELDAPLPVDAPMSVDAGPDAPMSVDAGEDAGAPDAGPDDAGLDAP